MSTMNRRTFLNWVGVSLVASSLPVAIAACTSEKKSETPASSTAPAAPASGQSIGTTAELDKTGQLLNKNSPVGPILVVGTSKTNIIAVNPTCTHKGCMVAWQSTSKQFACPCHGSAFGPDGRVLTGPAREPLKTYPAKIQGNSIVI